MKFKNSLLCLVFVLSAVFAFAQVDAYTAAIERFQQSRNQQFKTAAESPLDKKAIGRFTNLPFYPINQAYRVEARFTPAADQIPFEMAMFFGGKTMKHVKRGTLEFELNGKRHTLAVYQRSAQLDGKNITSSSYPFVPFRDLTSGGETYSGGRYIDLLSKNLGATVTLDFNVAYSPDCAYNQRFQCPATPADNRLETRVEAGEKLYSEAAASLQTTAAVSKSGESVAPNEEKQFKKLKRIASAPKKSSETINSGTRERTIKPMPSDENGKFADFDGVKVHYQSTGKGDEAIIFVHCWTCDAEFWRGQVSEFEDKRVITLDLPGHGRSDKPQIDYTMDYFARSIEAVMRDAKVKRAVLVGHSMGTPVIRQFYRIFPEKTLALVIVDGALRPMGTKAETEQFVAPLRADYKTQSAKMVDGMIASIKDEAIKSQIRTTMLAAPEFVGMSAMDGMNDEKIHAPDKINVPVLAILGESPYWAKDTEAFYRSLAPNLDFRMWQGVSHFLMMEKPQEFNQALRFFLNKNKLLN